MGDGVFGYVLAMAGMGITGKLWDEAMGALLLIGTSLRGGSGIGCRSEFSSAWRLPSARTMTCGASSISSRGHLCDASILVSARLDEDPSCRSTLWSSLEEMFVSAKEHKDVFRDIPPEEPASLLDGVNS